LSGARGGQRRGGQRAGGAGGSRRGPVSNPPPAGKYASAAEACLVALLEFTEMQSSAGVGDGGAGGSSAGCSAPTCPLEELLVLADAKLLAGQRRLNRDADYYLSAEVTDIGWMQIKKLCSAHDNAGLPQMIKERSNKRACASGKVFELLAPGRATAERIRAASGMRVSPGPLRELASPDGRMDLSLAHVVMAIDFREGLFALSVCLSVCLCVGWWVGVHTCIHTCMHAYMHTCIHAYMHTCIHAYMHTCILACMCMRAPALPFPSPSASLLLTLSLKHTV